MLNFVLGFFREYWPVVLASAFAWYGAPVVGKWLGQLTLKLIPDESDHHPGPD
ncbi:hypothetical protein AWB70_05632 [Caballeronia cordobensis]|uniref:Uncharacterized protein n=1 Tax=Caballeronia cordobensis TaxID=1353886 RepID=A0A158J0U8_CABCO|nr:hypothetical protein AWB70_05632 [Caballeronia cordobensis]